MSTPDCPRCHRSEVHRDVKVYEGVIFTLKTMDGEVHFEGESDLCDECLRVILLDTQKKFPSILDHGKVSNSMNWTGFIVAKRAKQDEEDKLMCNGVKIDSAPVVEEIVEEVDQPDEGEVKDNAKSTKKAK